jgi:hypothetical protein
MSKRNRTPILPGAGQITHRVATGRPSSYSKTNHSAQCVVSVGSAVQRHYGVEQLAISDQAVILDRMRSSGIPLLDSHNQQGIANAVGQFKRLWIGRSDGQAAMLGEFQFSQTKQGIMAEGMVARGEIKGISAGYIVRDWEVSVNGRVLDLAQDRVPMDGSAVFTATRWELLEGSLVSVPADAAAAIRSLQTGIGIGAARATRARMIMRMRALGMRGYA